MIFPRGKQKKPEGFVYCSVSVLSIRTKKESLIMEEFRSSELNHYNGNTDETITLAQSSSA